MLVMLLVVLVGFLAQKFKLMGDTFDRQLSNLVINLTCPCLIVSSVMGDVFPKKELILPLLLAGFITYIVLFVFCSQWPKLYVKSPSVRGMHSFMLMFGNVGFIGYPVVASVFGPEAVFYAAILNVPNTISVFVWGARFIAGRDVSGSLLSRLVTPAMIGTYLSIIVVITAWHAPHIIAQPITMIGNITVPASLLIIGYSISQIPAKHMAGGPRVWATSFSRLLLMPLLVFAVFQLIVLLIPAATFIFDPSIIRINTLIIAMPVASFGTIFCLKYGVDETVMAQGTFLTTILSLATIPVVASVL